MEERPLGALLKLNIRFTKPGTSSTDSASPDRLAGVGLETGGGLFIKRGRELLVM